MILTPKLRVVVSGSPLDLTFTLLSLYLFEVATGRGPSVHDPASVRFLLWAMARPLQPDITVRDIGRLFGFGEIARTLPDALNLISASLPPPEANGTSLASGNTKSGQSDWISLWSVGRFDLHLPESEFWELTPAMFAALMDRLRAQSGAPKELPMEEKVKMLQERVEAMNAAMGGRDLRKKR